MYSCFFLYLIKARTECSLGVATFFVDPWVLLLYPSPLYCFHPQIPLGSPLTLWPHRLFKNILCKGPTPPSSITVESANTFFFFFLSQGAHTSWLWPSLRDHEGWKQIISRILNQPTNEKDHLIEKCHIILWICTRYVKSRVRGVICEVLSSLLWSFYLSFWSCLSWPDNSCLKLDIPDQGAHVGLWAVCINWN